jgi:hypothetical protein
MGSDVQVSTKFCHSKTDLVDLSRFYITLKFLENMVNRIKSRQQIAVNTEVLNPMTQTYLLAADRKDMAYVLLICVLQKDVSN